MLQIVAGADYIILAATMGHAGNSYDSTLMKKHSFWKNRESIFPPGARVIKGVEVPYLEIGDSAFPITTRSMKPYTHNKLTDDQPYYNYRHSSARMIVEEIIGLLIMKGTNSFVNKLVLNPYSKCRHNGLLHFTYVHCQGDYFQV